MKNVTKISSVKIRGMATKVYEFKQMRELSLVSFFVFVVLLVERVA